MEIFQVKRESKNKRCDICHQRDLFDPNLAKCYRCENLIDLENGDIVIISSYQSMFLEYQNSFCINTNILKNRLVIIGIMLLMVMVVYFCPSLLIWMAFIITNPFTYIFCLLYVTESLGEKLLILNLNPTSKISDRNFNKYDSINESSPYWKLDFEKDI